MRRLGLTIVLLACAAQPAAAAVRPGAPGRLDLGFGHGGVATLRDPYLSYSPSFLAEQPDGGLLVGADASVPGSTAGPGFVVVRFDRRGRRDLSFGDRGRVEPGLRSARAAALPGGGFFVAGVTGGEFTAESRLARYTSRGVAEPGFAGGKLVTALPGPYVQSVAVAAQPDGMMLVAPGDGSVYRVTAAGLLDPGFGVGGRSTPSLSSTSLAIRALAVQPDGRIVLAGERRSEENMGAAQLLIARLMPDGSVDSSFGDGAGRVVDDNPADWREAQDLALAGDGTIFTTGYSSPLHGPGGARTAVWRYPADGKGGSIALAPRLTVSDQGTGLALDRAGGILALGRGFAGTAQSFLVRLRADGSADRGFGRGGRVIWPDLVPAAGPLLLRDGRIAVALRRQLGKPPEEEAPPNDVAVVRVMRLWGGYDKVAPVIGVRLSCARGKAIARVRVRDRSRIRDLRVWIAGRRIWPNSRTRVKLVLRRTGALRLVAADEAGNRASRTVRVRPCRVSG